MKKALAILLSMILTLLFACDKSNKEQSSTTTAESITSTTRYDPQVSSGISEDLNSTESLDEMSTVTASTTCNSSFYEETSPYNIVDFDIPKMKAALKASETMNDEDFEKYLSSNYPYAHNCEFNTPELYKNYIENVSEIKLAVVDDDCDNVGIANYYLESNSTTQFVYTTGNQRFVIEIDNPWAFFEENDETELIKSIQTDNFSADIFWSEDWSLYTGNIYLEGETYVFRAYEMDNAELVESELSRLSFVKISDLLNK